jgi:tripartite ATP-independent transporter DctP family solute receptor
MKKTIILVLTFVLALFVAGCTQVGSSSASTGSQPVSRQTEKAEIIFKVGSGGSDTIPGYVACVEVLKPQIEEKSAGRIKVELYPSSQLGDDVKLIEQLRAGTLECTIPITSPLVGLVPEISLFDVPFMFPDGNAVNKIMDGEIGKKLNNLLAEKGLINLYWGGYGFRELMNARRAVKTPADLKGLKIRTVENPIYIAMWKAIGANPTPMPVSETFTAIQQGTVDGQENSISASYGWRVHEVAKHITLSSHMYNPETFIVSKKIWDTYDQSTKNVLLEAGKTAALRSREIATEQDARLLEEMKKAGCTVYELTLEEKQLFQKAASSVWPLVEEKVGKELFDMLKKELGVS